MIIIVPFKITLKKQNRKLKSWEVSAQRGQQLRGGGGALAEQ